MVLGALASIFFGFWGFFNKLASGQSIYITNFIIYGIAFLIALPGLIRQQGKPVTGLLAGVSGGILNWLILFALTHHNLILIYPFVSFGTLVFIGLSFYFLGGNFSTHSTGMLTSGILLAFLGLVLCGIGISGGLVAVESAKVDIATIGLGILISLLTGFWNFFAFLTVTKKKVSPLSTTFWILSGSFLVSVVLLIIHANDLKNYAASKETLYSALSGFFLFFGSYSTFHAFRLVPGDTQRLEQTITVLLSNSEMLPILFLSILFLGERSMEGIVGAVLVLSGVVILHLSKDTA